MKVAGGQLRKFSNDRSNCGIVYMAATIFIHHDTHVEHKAWYKCKERRSLLYVTKLMVSRKSVSRSN